MKKAVRLFAAVKVLAGSQSDSDEASTQALPMNVSGVECHL